MSFSLQVFPVTVNIFCFVFNFATNSVTYDYMLAVCGESVDNFLKNIIMDEMNNSVEK